MNRTVANIIPIEQTFTEAANPQEPFTLIEKAKLPIFYAKDEIKEKPK